MNVKRFFLVIGLSLLLTLRALAEDITIPWYGSAAEQNQQIPFNTNRNFYVEHVGDTNTLSVYANPSNPKCWFKEAVSVFPGGVNIISQTGGNAHDTSAKYTFQIVTPNKQGSLYVSGFIEPCEGGGSGPPPSRYFSLYALWRWPFAYFLPVGTTNMNFAAGTTNVVQTQVMLGDATPLSGKMTWTSTVGTFVENGVDLAQGVGSTHFVASKEGGSGQITATGSELMESGFYGLTVPVPFNAVTNVTANSIKLEITEPNENPVTDNNFTFNKASPGVCNVVATGTSGVQSADPNLIWTLTSITGSTQTSNPSPAKGPNITFIYPQKSVIGGVFLGFSL